MTATPKQLDKSPAAGRERKIDRELAPPDGNTITSPDPAPKTLLAGINHVAVLTADTDRLTTFYEDVFGSASETLQQREGFRVTMVYIGEYAELNVFELAGNEEHLRQVPMFGRGRLDHLALQAASIDAFTTIRDRLLEHDATDGFVTDFGHILSLFFRDPDGLESEVCLANPDAQPGVHNPPGTPSLRYHPAGTSPPDRVLNRLNGA